MPYLASFRKGWESENLARFILSKFSFIAHPSTVSDDVGSDFFCTLFQTQTERRKEFLLPKNSFAIQIKSNRRKINVTNKREFLKDLEIPFFVGVISRVDLRLTIYSGQYMPTVFPYKWPNKLEIKLCDSVHPRQGYEELEERHFVVKFPKVIEINANEGSEELSEKVKILCSVCSDILKIIAAKVSDEFVFAFKSNELPGGEWVSVLAGSGSARIFRHNFMKRLLEVFRNLVWEFRNNPAAFNNNEFLMYENLLERVTKLYPNHYLLPLVTEAYNELKILLERRSGQIG